MMLIILGNLTVYGGGKILQGFFIPGLTTGTFYRLDPYLVLFHGAYGWRGKKLSSMISWLPLQLWPLRVWGFCNSSPRKKTGP